VSTGTFSPKDIKECHLIISFRAFVPRAFPIAQSLLLSMMHPCMGPMLPFSTQFPAWTIGNRNQVAGSPWAEVYVSKAPARSSSKPCAPWHCAHGNETAKFQEARESDLVLCINPHTHSARTLATCSSSFRNWESWSLFLRLAENDARHDIPTSHRAGPSSTRLFASSDFTRS